MRHQPATSIYLRDNHDSLWDYKWVWVGLSKLIIGKEREAGHLRGENNDLELFYINQSAAYGITLVNIISANARSLPGAVSEGFGRLGRTHRWRCASMTFCATPATFASFSWTPISSSSSLELFRYPPFQNVLAGEGPPSRSTYGSIYHTGLKIARPMTGLSHLALDTGRERIEKNHLSHDLRESHKNLWDAPKNPICFYATYTQKNTRSRYATQSMPRISALAGKITRRRITTNDEIGTAFSLRRRHPHMSR